MMTEEKNKIMPRTLYLVATPIGNLADMSERALKVLSEVDFIAAEDTRNTQRLLAYFGITKPLVSYHEHNKAERGEKLVERLLAGESAALVTDAGTPAISDPGADLVSLCAEHGVTVSSIPGACASIVALTLSALPTERFCFEGFLPTQNKERRARLEVLSAEERTMMLHEAPHKLRATLDDLRKSLGDERRITLCRELTKLNEEIIRTTLAGACEIYECREPKGEYVLVIEGTSKKAALPETSLTIEEQVAYYIEGGMSKMDAIKATAKSRGIPKNDVYKLMV